MYYLLTLFGGMLISVMVVFNGGLNERVGQTPALIIIHALGVLFTLALMLVKRQKLRLHRLPFYMYLAGLLGLLATVFNNLAFGRISVSAMMALGLLGESVSSLIADHFGILDLPRRPFRPQKLWGGLLTLVGILFMWNGFELIPVLVCLLAGVTVLTSRLINARQARVNGLLSGTIVHYTVGLAGSVLLFLLTGTSHSLGYMLGGPIHIYLGGLIGGVILLISSTCVGKIPSFYMTLTIFVGQVLAGLLLDMALTQSFPVHTMIGGLFVLVGLSLNLLLDRRYEKKAAAAANP